MLRVAVPNKGSLSEQATEMLREAGYRQRRDTRDLVLVDPEMEAEFLYLRPKDIATYVGTGQLDVGITGRDLLLDSGADAQELLALDFGHSRFCFAARPGTAATIEDLDGMRVATSYAGLVAAHVAELGIRMDVIALDGAVENAVRLGVADAVADVVDTGTSLRSAGLQIVGEPVLRSEAILIGASDRDLSPAAAQLSRRLDGLVIARRYVMMDYDVRVDDVDAAFALTPGIESPTVSPLHDQGWVAIRAMVERTRANGVMDQLWELGARGIIVSELLSSRL